ncbi:hypothetical protein F4604DRAFT_1930239 [Suillus subluteus]|nr:hypothetical protein F4604DRAFT_1930239 [Suillus subluteus]
MSTGQPSQLEAPCVAADIFYECPQVSPRRPSEYWLRRPGWIDGAIDPPHFYISQEEIDNARRVYGYLAQPVSQPATTPTLTQPIIQSMAPDTVTIPVMGHLVSITMAYTAPDKTGRGLKLVVKKFKTVKSDHIVLEDITRTTFIQMFLTIHELADQYSPGVHSGPGFKLSWTGSPGGKSGATTIENDHDFNVTISALMKKKKDTCAVSVEFDTDMMDGFRIRKRPHSLTEATVQDQDEELAYGTKVPRFDTFSEDAQLHAQYIIQLKKKWSCAKHQGEHGQDGHCYVSSMGEHLGLNHRKLKMWAAAWVNILYPVSGTFLMSFEAAGDATKHEPPNTADFDGAHDGRLTDVKPRGRTGPRSSSSSASDHTALLMAAMLPLLTKHLTPPNHDAPSTSSLVPTPATPSHVKNVPSPMSPVPDNGLEIHACLGDFFTRKGINLLASETVLMDLELTPDIVPEVPVARLCEVLSAVEGCIIKFQVFCKEWNARLEEKRSQV